MSSRPAGPRDPLSKNSPLLADGALSLSPFRTSRDRSISRPSSRTSLRTHSPSFSLDDPVAVRNQMSTLKHNIRQQQAQLNSLETIVRSGPRPYTQQPELADDYFSPTSLSNGSNGMTAPPPSSFNPASGSTSGTSTKMKRRSSHDVLLSLAGPESSLPLPLPKRDRDVDENSMLFGTNGAGGGIREGIPMSFSPSSSASYKRTPSPTRTLSRIPVSAVGNARALADEGTNSTPTRPPPLITSDASPDTSLSSASLQAPLPSPSKRYSLTPGGTTKVLADLQTGVVNARNALENTKAQLRMSQRTVATLTRQTEDLKEGRDRLRLENEGLNNVVARKERLLQEVLERARKAEAEATLLKSQLKTETTTSKKSLREMESALSESTALSQKSEREYLTLRDSLKHLTETWRIDTEKLREEMRKREEKVKAEAERAGKTYMNLLEEVKKERVAKEEVKALREEERKKEEEISKMWVGEIERLKEGVENEGKQSEEASRIAKHLSEELARLRRLMQNAGRTPSEDDTNSSQKRTPP